MRLRSSAALALVVAAVLLAPGARAQPTSLRSGGARPVSRTTEYSAYERATIRAALDNLGLEIDPAPEGKTIDRFDFVRLPVFDAREAWVGALAKVPIVSPLATEGVVAPRTLNALHHTTQEWIIRREMLLSEGEPYVQVLLDETARNMRARMPLQLSLVIIVPVKSKTPGKVSVLVITKDIWSLRLSYELAVTPGGIENFVLVPQETNLFGLQHTASTRFQLQPKSYTLGAGYGIPRFGTSWIGATASANIIMNRARGAPEGSSMSVSTGQSLYSTRTPWAWNAQAGYTAAVARRYVNAQVGGFDARVTPQRDHIPFEYKAGTQTASIGVTRSFGWALKNNFGLTFNATNAQYRTFDLSAFDPDAAAEFRRRALPRGEARVYPALSWATFKNDYLRTLNVATLALQEDYRLGHELAVSVYPVTRALGSSRDFLGVSARAAYAVALGDGIAGASVSTVTEDQYGKGVSDGSVTVSAGIATPRFLLGRFVANGTGINRYRNYLNARTFLGGDDRLRGYPSSFFFGKDAIFYNLEFRSRPLDLGNLQVGLAVFYDVGDAASAWHRLRPKQSVGFGFRTLLPQLNRPVFRFDFAFPMDRGPFPETGNSAPVDPFGFYFAFEQAFSP